MVRDDKMMKNFKEIDESKIVYNKKRKLSQSISTGKGYIIIGIKDKPSKRDIKETIRHEFAHLQTIGKKPFREMSYYERATSELVAYKYEKQHTTPKEWNEVLPVRIKDFIPYITWETEKEQKKTKLLADKILVPKKRGGNLGAIKKATNKLSRWWLEKPITIKPRVEKPIRLTRRLPRITPKRPRLKR